MLKYVVYIIYHHLQKKQDTDKSLVGMMFRHPKTCHVKHHVFVLCFKAREVRIELEKARWFPGDATNEPRKFVCLGFVESTRKYAAEMQLFSGFRIAAHDFAVAILDLFDTLGAVILMYF